jgi:hypothetical protein
MKLLRKLLWPVPYAVALVFCAAGLWKIYDLAEFTKVVKQIWIVPAGIRYYLPVAVPLTELCLAWMISIPQLRKAALGASCVLFALFIGFHIWNLKYGTITSCSCFGSASDGLSKNAAGTRMIVINSAAIVFIILWFWANRIKTQKGAP